MPTFLSLEEAERLLAAIPLLSRLPERDEAMARLFLQCGCRLSEVLKLTTYQLDLPGGWIQVTGLPFSAGGMATRFAPRGRKLANKERRCSVSRLSVPLLW